MEQPSATLTSRASELSYGAWVESTLVGLTGLLLSSVVAASNGGYFSDSWAWVGLVALCVATLRLILVPALPLRRLDWAFVAGLGAFAAWVALSTLWAPAATPSIDETIRDVSYAAVVLALLLVVKRRTVESLLVGVLLGVTTISTYTLLTRLQPDRVGDWDPATLFRLSGPIGYWNGLGLYSAMGVLLALGLVARSQSRVVQAIAGAAPVLLVPTMLFTFSRGAWLALGVGLAVAFVLDARRLQLLAAALVLGAVARSGHLARAGLGPPDEERRDVAAGGRRGRHAALLDARTGRRFRCRGGRLPSRRLPHPDLRNRTACDRRHRPRRSGTRRGRGVRGRGGPVDARAAWRRLVPGRSEADRHRPDGKAVRPLLERAGRPVARLGRPVPRQAGRRRRRGLLRRGVGSRPPAGPRRPGLPQPLPRGSGRARRRRARAPRPGDSALPLVAAARARRQPLTTGAFAAYAAFLAHAAIDWDWELAGVTLVALAAAVAVIVAARGDDEDAPMRTATRVALPAVTGVLALLALAAVLATVPLSRARAAYNRLDFTEAEAQAQKASDWAPWSSEALVVLGRSQLAQGKLVAARASFESAVAKSPNDWELWRDLAAASPPAAARVAIRRALALNPLESELKEFQQALAPTKS